MGTEHVLRPHYAPAVLLIYQCGIELGQQGI
jgi:hypothetical protein